MKLKDAVKILLCEVARAAVAGTATVKRCECEDPWPSSQGCAYGSCEIIVCRLCGRVIRFKVGDCHFPYS